MASAVRLALIFVVFVFASVGWLILGGVTEHRSREQGAVLDEHVGDLWGNPQLQAPPQLSAEWTTQEKVRDTRIQPGELAGRLSFSAPVSLAFFFCRHLFAGDAARHRPSPDELPPARFGLLRLPSVVRVHR